MLTLPVSFTSKMSASKLILLSFKFSCSIWIPGFSSTPLYNIVLNDFNKKADQSPLNLPTSIGASSHSTLEMEKLMSHMKIAIMDVITILWDSDEEVVPDSEIHDLLCKIHDILDKAVSMHVYNAAQILAFLKFCFQTTS